jgi:hypothetical protein
MDKHELKERVRRRTADKLYDFDRTTGRAPTQMPAVSAAQSTSVVVNKAGDLSAENLQQQVRLRAYEIYVSRGKQEGHALDDWLQAETEILAAQAVSRTA